MNTSYVIVVVDRVLMGDVAARRVFNYLYRGAGNHNHRGTIAPSPPSSRLFVERNCDNCFASENTIAWAGFCSLDAEQLQHDSSIEIIGIF